jgi:hypothetical protein
MPESFCPIVIIGSHRSGTSLIAQLLDRAGVFIGADQSTAHSESQFFSGLNNYILHLAHSEWDNPSPMRWLLETEDLCQAIVKQLRERCASPEAGNFLGPNSEAASIFELKKPWGFKDPRNTFTAPLWRSVFGQIKIIHIYRNGIDVARSLASREKKRRTRLDSQPRSVRCLSEQRAFELWAEYLSMAKEICRSFEKKSVLEIQYESLLDNPACTLLQAAKFGGIEIELVTALELTQDIDKTRGYAFLNESELDSLYEKNAMHPLMIECGYTALKQKLSNSRE